MEPRSLFCTAALLLPCISFGQDISVSAPGELYYLQGGIVISQYVIEPEISPSPGWHGMADLSNPDHFRLTDRQTRYLDIQFSTCDIDPFSPQPNISRARRQLDNCLDTHLWENDDIPQWIKFVGTAMALGAASEAGALDSEISVSIDLGSINDLFKPKID